MVGYGTTVMTNEARDPDDETGLDPELDHGLGPASDLISPAYSSEAQMLERARRRYGSVGMVIASGMLGIDKMLGRRPKEEIPSIWEASGEPGDIDGDGIRIDVDDETALESHPNRDAARTRRIKKRRS
jgi:hypothetical protein